MPLGSLTIAMEKFEDLYKSFKDRLANPLFFSFLCAWSAYNWEIVYTILKYDTKEIQAEGYISIYQYVKYKLSEPNTFKTPILIALGYTIFSPVIKNLIKILQSWLDSLTERIILKVNKGSVVSIERFIDLSKKNKEIKQELSEFYRNEAVIKTENENYKLDLENLKYQLNSVTTEKDALVIENKSTKIENENLIQQIDIKNEEYDVSFLNGSWTNTYTLKGTGVLNTEDILIKDGKYFLVHKNGREELCFIIHAFHRKSNNVVFFIKDRIKMEEGYKLYNGAPPELKYNVNFLLLNEEGVLYGSENADYDIQYKRR